VTTRWPGFVRQTSAFVTLLEELEDGGRRYVATREVCVLSGNPRELESLLDGAGTLTAGNYWFRIDAQDLASASLAFDFDVQSLPVPELSTGSLFGVAPAALAWARRRSV
jgi:hypothetical protein